MGTGNSHGSPESYKHHNRSWVSTAGNTVSSGIKAAGAFLKKVPNAWPWLFGRNNNIAVLKYSKDLGLSVQESEEGKITLRATEVLLGDIWRLSNEDIKRLNNNLSLLTEGPVSLAMNQHKNVVDIGIDVVKIESNVKERYPNMSEEQRKKVVIGEIVKAVDNSIKAVAKATGGELERYTDLKLVYGVAKKLYEGPKDKNDKEKIINSNKYVDHVESKEEICVGHNITNPGGFGFHQSKSAESIAKQPCQVGSHGPTISEIQKSASGLVENVLPPSSNTSCANAQSRGGVQQKTGKGGGCSK